MLKNLRLVFITSLLAMLSGCSTVAKNYLPDDVFLQTLDSTNAPYVTANEQVDLSKINLTTLDGASNSTKRNAFISKLVAISDKKCELHKATIISNSTSWNVTTGVASILFSGYAAVASNAANAANAAAAAAATTGIQGQVNQEVYQGKLATAILRAIDSARAKAYAEIDAGMKNSNYSAAQAITDVNRYHSSCSFMAGMTEITKALENRKASRPELERDISSLERTMGKPTFSALKADDQNEIKKAYASKLLELSGAKE